MTIRYAITTRADDFNPNHDDRGEFSSGSGGAGSTGGGRRTAESLYGGNAGFRAGMPNRLGGGHIVIYHARSQGHNQRGYLVMHEPSSNHIVVGSLSQAKAIMHGVATARTYEEAARHADILPRR